MANTIKIKRSAVQGKVPAVGDLSLGELALNTYDGKLYTLKNNGTISVIEIGASSGANFSTDVSLQNQSATRYYEASANGNNYIAIRAPSTLTTDVTLTLPANDGDPDQVLGTDGNGNLSWVSRVGGTGTTGDFLVSSTASEQSGYFGNIYLKDDSNASHYLEITNSADLTALRTLSVNVNDANRTVSLSGNLTVSAAATISGNNTGDQTITLTGNVTGSGTGSFATTIANSAVTFAKIQNISTARVLGRTTVGTGVVEELTTTGTGSVAFSTSPTLVTPTIGDARSTTLTVGNRALTSSYNCWSETGSGAMGVFGHNARSGAANNTVVANVSSWHGHFIRMYYSDGIAIHTTTGTVTAGDVLYDQSTPANQVASAGERVRIRPDGNVGIGVIAPSFKADIAGDVRVTSTNKMRFGGTAGTTNFYIQYNSTANSLDFVAG